MNIEKKAIKYNNFIRKQYYYKNARTAFQSFLNLIDFEKDEIILLPSYIGWSDREGSGVFDPVRNLNLNYDFYKINKKMEIDIEDLQSKIKLKKIKVLLIIHYFGFLDKNYKKIISIARENGILIVEDEAHALFTDFIGGVSGRYGDASIMSLHKLLPIEYGGLLILNSKSSFYDKCIKKLKYIESDKIDIYKYDFVQISNNRIKNAEILFQLLVSLSDYVIPLKNKLKHGEVPQSFPIIVKHKIRDYLYFKMNKLGYGVVSLYHTLINEIPKEKFIESYLLSQNILNLPIHQDIKEHELENMVSALKKCIDKALIK